MINRGRGKQENTVWVQALLLGGTALYLFVNLYTFSGTPFLLGGDQIYFWMYAQRMLHGERIYQDFFQFTPPGTDIFYLTLFKLFGPHLWITNAVVLLLGLALCWVCFSIARLFLDQSFALLAAFVFLVLIYASLMNASHHWFSLLAVLFAARIVMPERTLPGIAIAGLLLGIASCFTQTAGIAGAVALLLAFAVDRWYTKASWQIILCNQLLLLTAFGLVVAALNIYLATRVGPRRLWYFQINYPQRYVAYWFGKWFPGLPEPLSWRRLPHLAGTLFVYALLPVIYPLVLWHSWRKRGPRFPEGARLAMLSLVGFFLLLEIIPGVNWLRLYAVSMPGLILFIWVVSRSRMRLYIQVTAWIFVACFAGGQTWSRHAQDNRIARLPGGTTILSAQKVRDIFLDDEAYKAGRVLFSGGLARCLSPLGPSQPFVRGWATGQRTNTAGICRGEHPAIGEQAS